VIRFANIITIEKNRTVRLIFFFLLPFFVGCAYYNTFYNAERFYRDAEKERKKREHSQIVELSPEEKEQLKRAGKYSSLDRSQPSSQEMQNYQRAIEKASKVLEFHPNSRYVDDALMLLGKCFLYRQEYSKAMRKFEELNKLYPNSEFIEESRLLAARTLIGLGEFDEAESRFRDLTLDRDIDKRINEEAAYELAELYFEKGSYDLAVDEYQKSANESDDKLIRAMSLYRLGECYIQLKRTGEAEKVLQRAIKMSPNEDFRSQAVYKLGQAQSSNGEFLRASNTFRNLLQKEMDTKRLPMIKLQLAENLRLINNYEEAVIWFNNIIEEHKRTDASARSYFALAELEEFINGDYQKAQEYYDLVRGEFQNSAVAPIAKERSDDIKRLLQLRQEIARLEGRAVSDSVSADSSEIKGEKLERDDAPIDLSSDGMWVNYSGRDRPPPLSLKVMTESDRMRAKNRLLSKGNGEPSTADAEADSSIETDGQEDSQKHQLIEKKLAMAELLLFKFSKHDSSIDLFLNVLENTQDSLIAARTLYALGYTFDAVVKNRVLADSIFQRLVDLYPHSPQADGARRLLGLPLMTAQIDSAQLLYQEAERMVMEDERYSRAIDLFDRIQQRYPSSEFAAKAHYAMGWIYENRLYDNAKAMQVYQSLVDSLPDSPYAKGVKPKLEAAEKQRREQEQKQQAIADSLARLQTAKTDTTAADSLARLRTAKTDTTVVDSLRLERSAADSLKPTPVLPDTLVAPEPSMSATSAADTSRQPFAEPRPPATQEIPEPAESKNTNPAGPSSIPNP